ncbi:hypothetical protein MCC93_11550 [Morococcus cerebrosus]|uniref:Uncharacterized protein n=1 Tax=Morococcus cerebrosus TaxID=1056807 RepID=A0A0C1EIN8_9NEIS|nr:hypothetical protein MCC93_11550 [Morococcus cerebrosus]
MGFPCEINAHKTQFLSAWQAFGKAYTEYSDHLQPTSI